MLNLRILLALATALALGVVHGEQSIRMSYHFAFEDEGVLAPDRVPTKAEVEAVLCQTDLFYSKSLQAKLNNPKIAVVIQEVDFAFEDYHQVVGDDGVEVEMPVGINFTMSVMTTDGSTMPTLNAIQDAFPTLDYNAYLTKHVWHAAPVSQNFFFEARGLVWKSIISDDAVNGTIQVVDCPEGAQPEFMVEGTADEPAKEFVNATDFSADNGFSLKMAFWEGSGRVPTEMEWEALICEVDHFINDELKKKLHDPSISSYASMIHWGYVVGEYLPAQVNFSLEAVFGNQTRVPASLLFKTMELKDVEMANLTSQYINKAFPDGFNIFAQVDALYFRGESIRESSPTTTLAKANCPVTVHAGDLASFVIKFEFEDSVEREPTRPEVEALICETNQFFQKTLREKKNDPSIVSHATNIDWTYNPADKFACIVNFTALALYGDGSHVRSSEVFEIMQAADVQVYTEFYILKSAPIEQNIFYFAKNLFFGGGLGNGVITSKIPDGVKCQSYSDTRLPAFSVSIGFDSRSGAPTEQDVKGLMCQTNLYFEKRLRQELKDEGINCHATNIDWHYIPGAKLPATVNFTALTTYKDGTLVPGKLVYDIMKNIDVQDYVRNYVWNSEPYEVNIYYDSRDIEFTGDVNAPVRKGKLETVTCVAPGLANGSPQVTAASGPRDGNEATKKIEIDNQVTHLAPHE